MTKSLSICLALFAASIVSACTAVPVPRDGELAYRIGFRYERSVPGGDKAWRTEFLERAAKACENGHKVISGPSDRTIGPQFLPGGVFVPGRTERTSEIVCTEDGQRPVTQPGRSDPFLQAESALKAAEPVTIGEETVLIGVSEDRDFAIVKSAGGELSLPLFTVLSTIEERTG
ncbi:MAG: hypothetical protein AAGI70_02925, partial [Pseudomonadota bacterium]